MKKILFFSLIFIFSCNNSTEPEDCVGVIGGTAVKDECGVCNGNGPAENYDCSGNCIAVIDCAGVCGGISLDDECGTCGGSVVDSSECITDCPGGEALGCDNVCATAGSELVDDKCGFCGGPCNGDEGSECGNYDCNGACTAGVDCASECGGLATLDNCDTCDSDSSNDCFVEQYDLGDKIHSEHQAMQFGFCYPSCTNNPDNCDDLTTDAADTTFSLADHTGKVFMIEMSATW